MGTIFRLINMFKDKSGFLNNTNNEEFMQFERSLDSSINELMYQNAVHYIFYHEIAHLIQNSEFLESNLYEHLENMSEFSIRKHVLELDADEYSSICIGAHITQYAINNFGSNLTSGIFEKLLIIVCSSALLFMMTFQTNKKEIYYEEMSHPHPIIRITCIISVIVNYSLDNLRQQGINLQIDPKQVVAKTISFSSKVSVEILNENPIEIYQKQLEIEALNISKYIKKTNEIKEGDQTLAAYKWNIMARKLHS